MDRNLLTDNERKRWFVLYTKPKQEYKARERFNNLGVFNYLPTQWVYKRWSDRKKEVEVPLFRGYIFIRATEYERIKCLESETIVRSIFFDGIPAIIPDEKMDNLQNLITLFRDGIHVSDKVEIGKTVIIRGGPLDGTEGIVFENDKHGDRFGITINFLNRTVSVKLSGELLDVVKEI